jgi:hypothetical protein
MRVENESTGSTPPFVMRIPENLPASTPTPSPSMSDSEDEYLALTASIPRTSPVIRTRGRADSRRTGKTTS